MIISIAIAKSQDILFSFLPLAHTLERCCELAVFMAGGASIMALWLVVIIATIIMITIINNRRCCWLLLWQPEDPHGRYESSQAHNLTGCSKVSH